MPLFGSDYWETPSETGVDAWMSCSPQLANIMCHITEMSRNKPTKDDPVAWQDFSLKAATLANQLQALQQIDMATDDLLARSAELKRISAALYLQCALYDASPSTPSVVEQVRLILREVSEFLCMGVVAGLSFVLFVTRVELYPLNDGIFTDQITGNAVYGRPLILSALETMSGSSVSNMSRTRAVIQKFGGCATFICGRTMTRMAKSTEEGTNSSPLNDWEYFVAPISTNVSLA